MAQGVLPYQYQAEGTSSNMTALAGLPVYLDLMHIAGLAPAIEKHLKLKTSQGWKDSGIIMSLVLLNLAGGDCVDDLTLLEKDHGFCKILAKSQATGRTRKERREEERRWRRGKKRSVPSPSAVFRYLDNFHDPAEEKKRIKGQAMIPAPNEKMKGLLRVGTEMLTFAQKKNPQKEATLEMDATLSRTNKETALYCYKSYQAYQPLNIRWAEQGLILHSEFRDGNVPSGYEQPRVFQEALDRLPEGIEKVNLLSDTAGYEWELLKYCAEGKNERFGVIEFAVGVDVSQEFKKAVAQVSEKEWSILYRMEDGKPKATGQEWAEVCYVPGAIGHSLKGPGYRFIAIREALEEQQSLPSLEQKELPFPTMSFQQKRYKIHGIVTNRQEDQMSGDKVIEWYRSRCGKSEEAHAVMKTDFTGGMFPSSKFGVNAAWWQIMILAMNLNEMMKRIVLGMQWIPKRMKAVRFSLIALPGKVMGKSRQLFIRLAEDHPALQVILEARGKIQRLAANTC